MNRKALGKTSLLVSPISLGTVEIALDYGIPADNQHHRPAEPDAIRFLNSALDLGVNFIDTARVYGDSEQLIGKAIGARRREYVLATKLAPITASELENEPSLRSKVRSSVEDSLRHLQTDYLDVLMIHSASLEVIQQGGVLLQILQELKKEGLTRYVGASVYENAGPAAVQTGLDVLQIGYNALDRSPEIRTLPLARQCGCGIVARSVLLKGVITPRYKLLPSELESLKVAAAKLELLAQAAGISLVELAYRYVLAEDVAALCGTARFDELAEVVRCAERGRSVPI